MAGVRARLRILGALLDAAAHGLQMLPQVRLEWLLRMADFALWVAASEMGFHPEGAFEAAYSNNRRDAIENIVRPTQWRRVCVRLWPTERNGREALPDLLLAGANVVTQWLGTALAGQRIPAHSLAGCTGPRPSSAHSGLRSSSAARGGWEGGQSG
jgi:hypothetical protein